MEPGTPGPGLGAAPGLGASAESAHVGSVVELRVHGVSGTPPAAMLADPLPVRVAGDQLAGFYRRGRTSQQTEEAFEQPVRRTASEQIVPEAFSWGSLTSGAAARALWLLLLPFTLVNVSYWMRPQRRGRADRVSRWLLRVLALSLTATLVLAAIGVSVDLIAWQCTAPRQPCGAGRSWLHWLTEGFWSTPGRRLLVGALVPAAVIGLLWYLGRRTWSSYESVRAPDVSNRPDLALAEPSFWAGRRSVRELRCLHIAVAVSTVDGALLVAPLSADRLSGRTGSTTLGVVLVAIAGALVVGAVAALAVRRAIDRDETDQDEFWTPAVALLVASLTLFAAVAVYLAGPSRARWPDSPILPGYPMTVTTLFSVQVALLLGISALIWLQRRQVPAGTALGGYAAPVFAGMGLLVACAFAAGATFRVADFLDGAGTQNRPTATAASTLRPPPQYSWASLGFLLALVSMLAVALAVVATRLRGRRLKAVEAAYAAEVRSREDGLDPAAQDRRRLRRISRARLAAGLTDHLSTMISFLVVPGSAFIVLVTVTVLLTPDPPAVLAQRYAQSTAPAMGFLTNLGTWLVSGFALALLLLGRAAYRTLRLRRVVGILWDLGTFWPRGAHPLAPPCYAERAVPDLVRRATWLAEGGTVLLSAHSQGSVLSAAALLQMPPAAVKRVCLLTYGCPLHRLYARYFPAYFDESTLEWLRLYLPGRWTNLTRPTDPIGGPVFPAAAGAGRRVDRALADPVSFGCPPQDTVPPPLLQHSEYWADPAYYAAVRELLAGLATAPAADRAR